jgi:thiol:disulfide interchange protein DsbG
MTLKPIARITLLSSLLGLALVAQAKDWPAPIKALEAQGVAVIGTFEAPGGLTGYAGSIHQQPLAIYLTPDGQHTIVGTLLDAKGENLSEAPLKRLVSQPLTEKVWQQLETGHWIADGAKNAPRIVYTFTDPNCPYCNKFWNDARPWVSAGKVQVRHIMVGILRPSSPGKAAALLAAKNPQSALTQHVQQHSSGGVTPLSKIPDAVRAKLDANYTLMQQLGFAATPAILYKDDAGQLQTTQGAPSAEVLSRILGPR